MGGREGGREGGMYVLHSCVHPCTADPCVSFYVIHTVSFSPCSTAFSFTVFLVLVMVCTPHSMKHNQTHVCN